MIKLCNYKSSAGYRGSLPEYLRERVLESMSPAQQWVLREVEWSARRHPKRYGFIEIYVDPANFPKNKLLLAQMVFG